MSLISRAIAREGALAILFISIRSHVPSVDASSCLFLVFISLALRPSMTSNSFICPSTSPLDGLDVDRRQGVTSNRRVVIRQHDSERHPKPPIDSIESIESIARGVVVDERHRSTSSRGVID